VPREQPLAYSAVIPTKDRWEAVGAAVRRLRVPGAELDEIARPSDVAAIEVYPTLGAIPPQFADMPSQCGSIVVWMR
jgi:hypothetical protein